jgi:hypothetical protein
MMASFLAILVCLPMLSCGGEAPEILAVDWRMEKRLSKQGNYESLSAFANVKDLDGIEDIDSIEIIQDDSGLSWKLSSSTWTRQAEGGDNWIGAANLVMPDYSPLPRGEYRFVAISLSGQRAEKGFSIAGTMDEMEAPNLSFANGEASISSSWPETILLAYDGAGSLIGAKNVSGGRLKLTAAFGEALEAKIQSVAAYGYNAATHSGAYSWKSTKR